MDARVEEGRGRLPLRVSAWAERVRSSLFFVPMLFVLLGGALGAATVELDARLEDRASSLPFVLTSTVDSAREILGVVASATITVAGVAFSITLLVIQQASSQYSPRVVHSLFRDPFNRRVMGLALGTFTYALMVLRTVRSPLDGGDPVVPHLSVALAVVLGVVALLGIIAFIDHNAHTMEVSQILHRVTGETIDQVGRLWPVEAGDGPAPPDLADDDGHRLLVGRSGWIQQVSPARLLDLVPDGGTVRLETRPGRYAVRGTVLCTVWPAPADPEAADRMQHGCTDAVEVGPARTMQQDPSYGIRQLADVALIALSPGVNDPSTAQDAIFHLADVLREVLARDLPPAAQRDDRGRTFLDAERPTHDDLVRLAFDEVRRAAAPHPTVCVYLLEALHLLVTSLPDADTTRLDPLRRQAELVLAGAERADVVDADRQLVRRAYELRFGAPAPT